VTSRGSLPRAHFHLTFGEPWWNLEMLRTSPPDGFCHHVDGFFSILILIKSITFSTVTHWRIMWYHTSMCFVCLWYMQYLARYQTLTVTVDLNWILYDSKCADQSSQPQDFLRCLNCSHVLCLCCWKCHSILQVCLPTNDTLSYCKYITHRRSSLIKISCIMCINIFL